jgi:hypothetical protein
MALAATSFAAAGGLDLTRQMHRDSRIRAADWLTRNQAPGDTLGYYGAAAKLPRTPQGVVIAPMAGQLLTEEGVATVERPPFVIVIPQQDNEPLHEWTLPPEGFAALMDGSAGYRQMAAIQTRGLFRTRPIPFVNPPVRIFVRDDVLPRLRDQTPIVELQSPDG